MRDITFLHSSLIYVYDSFLSEPFGDIDAPRGTYIDKKNSYRSYPAGKIVAKDASEVYRPNHGLAHNVRVTGKVRDVAGLYADSKNNNNNNLNSKGYFEALNEEAGKQKLEVVCSFYVAGRGSEAGFSIEFDSPYQRYRQASCDAFYAYAKNLTRPNNQELLFTPDELALYQTVLRDPYFNENTDLSALKSSDERQGKISAAKAVLSSCHALDLARCFHVDKMNHKVIEVLAPLDIDSSQNEIHQNVIRLFVKSEIQHILTGNKVTSALDQSAGKFIEQQQPEKRFLFHFCGINPEVAIRCVSLSNHIENIGIANALAVSLNRYALNGVDELKGFLTRVEQCFTDDKTETLDDILKTEEIHLSSISNGRIFKTIRNDAGDFWDIFAKELVSPSVKKPELREGAQRKRYTVKLKNDKYQVVSTNKEEKRKVAGEEYNEQDKKNYTRHQSTSYSNYQIGYNPPCFGHNRLRNELLVGVSFDPADCQHKRIMMYDGGTIDRPYDFDSQEEAEQFIKEKLDSGLYHATLQSLQAEGLSRLQNRHNEVMTKLRWTAKSSVTVFSDNLESKLLAQVRAADLKNRFQEKFPGRDNTIPITIYPEFSEYSLESQATDREMAAIDNSLKPYLIVLSILEKKESVENLLGSLSDDTDEISLVKNAHALEIMLKINSEYSNLLKIDGDFAWDFLARFKPILKLLEKSCTLQNAFKKINGFGIETLRRIFNHAESGDIFPNIFYLFIAKSEYFFDFKNNFLEFYNINKLAFDKNEKGIQKLISSDSFEYIMNLVDSNAEYDNEFISIALMAPWDLFSEELIENLLSNLRRIYDDRGPYDFFKWRKDKPDAKKHCKIFLSCINKISNPDILNKVASFLLKNNYICSRKTLIELLQKNNIFQHYPLERIDKLGEDEISRLNTILAGDKPSEELLVNGLDLVEKTVYFNSSQVYFLGKLLSNNKDEPLSSIMDTVLQMKKNCSLDKKNDDFYFNPTSLIYTKSAPDKILLTVKACSFHREPSVLREALIAIDSEKPGRFFSAKKHANLLVEYLQRKYVGHGGRSNNGIFSDSPCASDSETKTC